MESEIAEISDDNQVIKDSKNRRWLKIGIISFAVISILLVIIVPCAVLIPKNKKSEPISGKKSSNVHIAVFMDRMRNSFMISGIGDITYDHTFFAPTVNFASGSAALSYEDGSHALICFDDELSTRCENFDGFLITDEQSLKHKHEGGSLGLYKNEPVAIGNSYNSIRPRSVETLTHNGWESLPDHPYCLEGTNLVGLKNGNLLSIGGVRTCFETEQQTDKYCD
ncbi:unnamed protein product [Oikopleura dioica]|uniref:Uncharacterized protein n=1 Tax=Oikopleura dioica TaxID=34765 RepID=E4XJW4_OIKDI|nr:unnamed protein product [Oikopleura dioica]